jgi:LPXTG-motif cell wall-anchored protein
MTENPNGFDFDEAEVPPPNSSGNQGFILVVSILGGLFLIALIVMAIFVTVVLPRNRAQQSTQTALIYEGNTATIVALTEAAMGNVTSTSIPLTATLTAIPTETIQAIEATATLDSTLASEATNAAQETQELEEMSPTPVVMVASDTPAADLGSVDSRTATVAALLTQAADAKLTTTVEPTSTALPSTGFATDSGIPSLLGIAVVLLAVIFLVRRLRTSHAA